MNRAHAVLAYSLLAGTLLSTDGLAQDKATQLRSHLGLSEEAVVKPSLRPSLPGTTPLRVALAFGVDIDIIQNFTKWVEDWNRKDAKKYGRIDLVEAAQEADVVLVRFLDRTQSAGEWTSASAYAGNSWAAGSAASQGLVPVYAFILTRNEAGFEILGGYEDTTIPGRGSGRQLWEDFKKLMKKRTMAR